jgi:hypothetical protein
MKRVLAQVVMLLSFCTLASSADASKGTSLAENLFS